MSLSLDEYKTSHLEAEIQRREACWTLGNCYYCGRSLETHHCRLKSQVDSEKEEREKE